MDSQVPDPVAVVWQGMPISQAFLKHALHKNGPVMFDRLVKAAEASHIRG